MLNCGKSLLLSLISVCLLLSCVGASQEIRVNSAVTASPSAGGWYPWYEMHVDPENASHVIICGARFNPKNDAFYGFVYFSGDGGKTWEQAFEDRSSTWVSEESCAFGVDGIAYFVAAASKVIDGVSHHELGTTRIYVSRDAGSTWTLGTRTGWTDFSTSTVDMHSGSNQNRLYIFFNSLSAFYSSIGKQDLSEVEATTSSGTRVGMISYKAGDRVVSGPFSSDGMKTEGDHGSYPSPAFVLNDGSVLTFYTTKRRSTDNRIAFVASAVRADPDRTTLQTPVKIIDSLDNAENPSSVDCGGYFLNSSAAYDAQVDKLYFIYPDIRDGTCQLFVATSGDGGKSWSKGRAMHLSDQAVAHEYRNVALAFNKNGQLGVLWQDTHRSGCWKFAVSTNGGKSLSDPRDFGTCSTDEMKPSALNAAYLWASFFQADPQETGSTDRIVLRNTRNGVQRNSSALVAMPDGTFRAAWIDAGNGSGELRTAYIQVTPIDTLISEATNGLEDVTHQTVLLYGGDQSYDPKTKILTLDVVLRNDASEPLRAPIKLAVSRGGESEFTDIANASNGISGAGAVWDISSAIPDGGLAPGATTKPFALKFHYLADPDTPRGNDGIGGLRVKVYARR